MYQSREINTIIHSVGILPFGMINCFLVQSGDSLILVDTGLPDTHRLIENKLKALGKKFVDIDLIVVTHAHIDHAGNAALLRELCKAPVVGHRGDLSHFQREVPMQFCATGVFGRLFYRTGLITKSYAAFTPDILLSNDELLDLADYGVSGKVFATPGHTDGSISLVVDGQHALVGDLVSSGILLGGIALKGRAKRPPFEDNPHTVSKTLNSLLQSGAKTFYMGHGGPLPATEVKRHAHILASLS